MAKVGELVAELTIDSKDFDKNLDKSGDKAMNFGSILQGPIGIVKDLGKVALATGAVVGGAMVGIGISSIKAASDAEEMESKFNTVFKDLAGSVTDQLTEFAGEVNRSAGDLKGFASQLQDTFVPLGFARSKAADMSVELTQLAVDLSSFNNVAEETVVADLQSAMVGNTETLRKYGIVATQATIEQKAMEEGIWDGVDAITAQEKAAAIMQIAVESSGDALGDAARTSDGFANQMRGLQSTIKDLQVGIGKALLPVVTPFVGLLNDFIKNIGPIITTQIESLAEGFDTLAGGIGLFLTDGDALNDNLWEIAQSLGIGKEEFRVFGETLESARDSVLQIKDAITFLFTGDTQKSNLHAIADKDLIDRVNNLRDQIITLKDSVISFGQDAIGFLKEKYDEMKPTLEEFRDAAVELFDTLKFAVGDNTEAQENMKLGFMSFIDGAVDGLQKVIEGITLLIEWLNEHKEELRATVAVASQVFSFIASAVGAVISIIGSLIKFVANLMRFFSQLNLNAQENFKKIGDFINNNIVNPVKTAIDWVADLIEKIKQIKLPGGGGNGGGLFGGLFGGAKADGGPVRSNRSYLVGEEGPEMFVPNSNGKILPADVTAQAGGKTLNLEQNYYNLADPEVVMARMAFLLQGL